MYRKKSIDYLKRIISPRPVYGHIFVRHDSLKHGFTKCGLAKNLIIFFSDK